MEKSEKIKIMGERIRALRTERCLTQKKMAELLEVTQNHYQKIEYGKINISVLMLCTLADYYGVSTDYLLGRSESRG